MILFFQTHFWALHCKYCLFHFMCLKISFSLPIINIIPFYYNHNIMNVYTIEIPTTANVKVLCFLRYNVRGYVNFYFFLKTRYLAQMTN
jgi:hypothetical protein